MLCRTWRPIFEDIDSASRACCASVEVLQYLHVTRSRCSARIRWSRRENGVISYCLTVLILCVLISDHIGDVLSCFKMLLNALSRKIWIAPCAVALTFLSAFVVERHLLVFWWSARNAVCRRPPTPTNTDKRLREHDNNYADYYACFSSSRCIRQSILHCVDAQLLQRVT